MQILIVFLPLIGCLGSGFFGRYLGKGGCYFAFINVSFSFLLSCILIYDILNYEIFYRITLFPWIYSDSLKVNWAFQFDSLVAIMLFIITFISALVHLYSLEYMEFDPHLNRFISYLSLFTFFMLILVTANNFLQMFVGWEGVGLSSYLLINFWYTRIQANKAAIKAMLVNRIGDFAILIALFLIYFVFNSLDFDIVFSLSSKIFYDEFFFFSLKFSYIDLITFFLFIGAMGKSAQLGLHLWLPDAMEGPTPVSALIHAATMVTAGIFLIVRCSFFFEMSSFSLNVILFVGSLTTFFSSTIGLFQNDIKKIIAYSTCSQLGYMIFACGLSSYDVAMFHLSNHAFFKALLFLAAGSVIHSLNNEQDLRKYGGLKTKLPLAYAVMLIGSFALMGFPYLSGFYSKDAILELAYSKYTSFSHFAYVLGALSVFSTSFYSIRLLYLVFLAEPNGSRETILNSSESGSKILSVLSILCIFSIFVGFVTKELFIGVGTLFWKNSIFILPSKYLLVDVEFISTISKIVPLFLSFAGGLSAFLIYNSFLKNFYIIKISTISKKIFFFFNKRLYFDKVYNQLVAQNVLNLGFLFFYKEIDRGFLEQFGPYGIIQIFEKLPSNFKPLYSGDVFHFLFLLFAICFFLFFFVCLFSFFFNNFLNVFILLTLLLLF